ncbi:MAG: V-type ATP synthase subunit F [Vicinamibacterales bacterium]
MALNVRVVCRPTLAAGFELAGLAVTRAADAGAAGDQLKRLAADPDVGLVLVDDGLYRLVPADLKARLDRQALPVVAPIPAPDWDARIAAEAYILEILRQAIGYRVRPR